MGRGADRRGIGVDYYRRFNHVLTGGRKADPPGEPAGNARRRAAHAGVESLEPVQRADAAPGCSQCDLPGAGRTRLGRVRLQRLSPFRRLRQILAGLELLDQPLVEGQRLRRTLDLDQRVGEVEVERVAVR